MAVNGYGESWNGSAWISLSTAISFSISPISSVAGLDYTCSISRIATGHTTQ